MELTVEPRATSRVVVEVDKRMWRRWDSQAASWDMLSGRGQLLIARGLGDIRATLEVGDKK
jgi:beta-glucosidase